MAQFMTWQEKAIRQIRGTLAPTQGNALVEYMKASSSLEGSESVFRRIAQAAKAPETLGRYWITSQR